MRVGAPAPRRGRPAAVIRAMKRRSAPETGCADAQKVARTSSSCTAPKSSGSSGGLATIGGPSWSVDARVGDEGRHGRPLCVEWASPRPMLEVKIGLGILDDHRVGGPTSFECVTHRSQQSPAQCLRHGLLSRLTRWPLHVQVEAKAVWRATIGRQHLLPRSIIGAIPAFVPRAIAPFLSAAALNFWRNTLTTIGANTRAAQAIHRKGKVLCAGNMG